MNLVLISPEHDDPREPALLHELFAAGLERYHVRKPAWSREKLDAWLRPLPHAWRPRLVLHQHHELATTLDLAGVHFRDHDDGSGSTSSSTVSADALFTSRSCHNLATLRAALGRYDSVFFSPIFPSLSKPSHAPPAVRDGELHEIKSPLILQPGPAALTDGVRAIAAIVQAWAARHC